MSVSLTSQKKKNKPIKTRVERTHRERNETEPGTSLKIQPINTHTEIAHVGQFGKNTAHQEKENVKRSEKKFSHTFLNPRPHPQTLVTTKHGHGAPIYSQKTTLLLPRSRLEGFGNHRAPRGEMVFGFAEMAGRV